MKFWLPLSDALAKLTPANVESGLFLDATKIYDLTKEEQSRLRVAVYGLVSVSDNSLYQIEIKRALAQHGYTASDRTRRALN